MSEWKDRWENTTLNEVCDLIPGFAFKSKDFGDYPTKAIKIGDIHPPRINTDTLVGVNLEAYNITKLEKFKVLKGDFILAMTGATIGKIGRYNDEAPAYINQRTLRFCVNDSTDSQFIYYVVNTNYFRDFIFSHVDNLTAQPNISAGTVATYTFQLPPLEVQQRISAVLTVLDEKIELNRRLNDNLEAMAQALYDYWFVQFDFPDENGKPYKTSGGKMVWNEVLKREIPEGWSAASLQSIQGNIITGKTPSTAETSYFGGDVPFITIDDIRGHRFVFRTSRTLTEDGAATQSKKYLPENSLCCSCIGTVGVIGFTGRKSQTNQQINSIVFSDKRYAEFIYFSLLLHFKYADAKMGNVIKNMNKEEFASISLLHPPMALIEKFHKATVEAFERIKNAEHNTVSLQEQRDFLLPLLMNGQVKVTE